MVVVDARKSCVVGRCTEGAGGDIIRMERLLRPREAVWTAAIDVRCVITPG